jgi:hypothetical protein
MATTYKTSSHVEGALIQASSDWEDGVRKIHVDREYSWSCKMVLNGYTASLVWNGHIEDMGPPDYSQEYSEGKFTKRLPLSCTQSDIRNLVDEAMKLIPEGEPQRVFKRQSA